MALVGDSIFDNGVYVSGEPDVARQLRDALPSGWQVSLLAVDGAVTSGVERQLGMLPPDATHIVVSVGGNDALGESHLLAQPCRTVGDGIARLAEAQASFAMRYHAMVESVLALALPTALCTIYDANYGPPQGPVVTAGLALFNDMIMRAAFARALPVIDLRLICSEPSDYANPIEPSARGGAKIAAAITRFATEQDHGQRSTVIASA